MPSTYSSSLRLELQATGENANTWGTKTNNNLELIEQAIAGYVKITLTSASATYPLVIADASASDGRNAYIEFVGTVASAISITVPDVEKGYWVKNSATGSPLTFRTSSGTGVVLPTNQWVNLVSDGASITSTFPTSITGYALLSATQTFTGANTFTSLVNIQSNLSVTGNAFVSGVTTLASAVDIKGATSLASTLVVGGAATFNSNVSVSGVMVVGAGAVGAPSYSTTGDTNTGLYFPAADTIAVATSGTERMRITSAGDVAIGINAAASKLHVYGGASGTDTRVTISNAATGLQVGVDSSNNSIIANNTANALGIYINSIERMRITSSGNVGIGTSSPGQKLDVAGNLLMSGQSTADQFIRIGSGRSGNGFSFIDLVGDTTYSDGLRLIRYNSGANAASSIEHRGTGNLQLVTQEAAPIAFYTNSGLNLRMLITATGDVGIGTASPGAKLEVAGTLTATGNTINFGGNDATNTIMNVGGVPTGNKYAITDYIGDSTYTDFGLRVGRVNDGANGTSLLQHRGTGPMILDVFDAGYLVAKTNSTERMRINSSGNVGIGTGSPAQRLHIATAAAPSGTTQTFLRATGDLGYGADFGGGIIQGTGAIATISTVDNGTATERMRIDSSGNVGIGTASPAYKLDLNGAFRMPNATVLWMNDSTGTAKETLQLYSDNNTYLSTPTALIFRTNGTTERMRITSTGLVGIGTSSPNSNAVLTNNGNIAIAAPTRNQATSNKVGVWTSDDPADNGRASMTIATVAGGSSSSSYISFETNNYGVDRAERMRIDSSGNVGIGTSSPTFKLVAANSTTDGAWLYSSGAVSILGLGGYSGATDGAASIRYDRSTGAITFNGGNRDSQSERMRIDYLGNVGIGTSSPNAYGRITSSASATQVSFMSADAGTAGYPAFGFAGQVTANGGRGAGMYLPADNTICFSTLGAERLRLDGSGNVIAGGSVALATNATNGFLYVPTCAGTPTGTPTAITGMAPIVINTTNNKLYFYSGGAWRDAGP